MRFEDVLITGLARVDAPERVTTDALEARLNLAQLGLLPGTLKALSGIEARRFFGRGTMPSSAATDAGRAALAQAELAPTDIGVLINTSVSRDYVEPSTACLVHAALGLGSDCLNFDLSNACLGFLNGMALVAQMIERGHIEHGLIVNGENSRPVVDKTLSALSAPGAGPSSLRDNLATLTLGSGAAAAVLSRLRHDRTGHRFQGIVSVAATEHNHLCRGQTDWMHTDATGLLTAGLDLARKTWARATEEFEWSQSSLDWAVMHQVSRVHTEKLAGALELPMTKVPTIYRESGNVGPASVPMTLHAAREEGRLCPGQRIGLMGIGSGLNCAMAEVVW